MEDLLNKVNDQNIEINLLKIQVKDQSRFIQEEIESIKTRFDEIERQINQNNKDNVISVPTSYASAYHIQQSQASSMDFSQTRMDFSNANNSVSNLPSSLEESFNVPVARAPSPDIFDYFGNYNSPVSTPL